MELDRNYFNQIRLNTRRGKFYDIEAVDRLLVDIRSRADSMNREYASVCQKLAEALQTVDTLREENTDLFMKGQALSQEVLTLRDELKAAQSGEAFLIPENDDISASSEPSSEESSSAESEIVNSQLSTVNSSAPAEQEAEDTLLPPDLVTPSSSDISSFPNFPGSSPIVNSQLSIVNSPSPSPSSQEADEYVLSSSSPQEEAGKILASAYAEAAAIRNSARQLWDNTVSRLDSVFSMIREINTYSIEKTDRIRQEFIDNIPKDEKIDPPPADLTEKIGRIAEQLSEMEDG